MPRHDDPATDPTDPADSTGTTRTGVTRTGMTRKVDDLGRVVLPAEIRRTFGIGEGDLVDIAVQDDRIILRRVVDTCVFCGTDIDLAAFRGKQVCRVCRKSLAHDVD
jgi:transcriptional pleiotropic regulator of transition state genes